MVSVPRPTQPVRVWGIDLGTTNSSIAEVNWNPGMASPECNVLELRQPTDTGEHTGPLISSCVAVVDKGLWVGEGAKRLVAKPEKYRPEANLFYGSKNEMGLRRTYARAPEHLDMPWKIGGQVLRFMYEQAAADYGNRPQRTVVTVPASFQINQRQDTLRAAKAAGLDLRDFDLLDEPTAALIAYLMSGRAEEVTKSSASVSNLLVFDFGGGTCDISIVRLSKNDNQEALSASMLAVSRYHRIGGADIDSAIVHHVLIPALLDEHDLEALELSWTEKKKVLEPQLIAAAEALKTALCREIRRLRGLGRWSDEARLQTASNQPSVKCKLGNRELILSNPRLRFLDFEQALHPYLNREALYPHETDYTLSTSIFAPLSDALDRANLSASEIDAVLMVGGSSLNPIVQDAVQDYFAGAKLCRFDDPTDMQLAVARGAAWHAYFLETLGKPFIQPVVPESIALITQGGKGFELIPAGATVPFPQSGEMKRFTDLLTVPKSGASELAMEVVAQPSGQVLLTERWELPDGVDEGDPISLEVQLTANHQLLVRASLSLDPNAPFECAVDNPLVNTVNPSETRQDIHELEELLRRAGPLDQEAVPLLAELARLYATLNQHERAIEFVRTALRVLGQPDADLLNLQGIYYGELDDLDRSIRSYSDAIKADPRHSSAWFNLSLAKDRQGDLEEAFTCAEKAASLRPDCGPYLTQKAMLLLKTEREEEGKRLLSRAAENYPSLEAMSRFELIWYRIWARTMKHKDRLADIEVEFRRRATKTAQRADETSDRPQLAQF